MVMAGNENGAGPTAKLADEPLISRLQWLQQRRQTLQEKLILKNNELKNLCIDEAELTGILPPEIPLEPGESPPSFRRRVGTAYTYPQNLINKLKTTEAEESALELERQVQVGIAEAALGIFNDSGESKAVRRKHRLVYQQSQRRLQELDVRLNFIRQGSGKASNTVPRSSSQAHNHNLHKSLSNFSTAQSNPHPQTTGGSSKHRSKKPRPPLEGERVSKSSRGLLQEGGVSLSPLSQEQNYNTYPGTGYHEVEPTAASLNSHYNQNRGPGIIQHQSSAANRQQQSPKLIVSNDLNDNHNVYILPDQYRGRTYSHGSSGGSGSRNNSSQYLDTERNYRPVPNTYTEQERLLRYRPLHNPQQQLTLQNHQQYPDYKNSDNETIIRYNNHHHPQQFYHNNELNDQGLNSVRRYLHTAEYQSNFIKNHHQGQQQQNLQRRDHQRPGNSLPRSSNGPPTDPHQPPGYWVRYEDEIIWCPDDNQEQGDKSGDKFGSLDRRKRNTLQHVNNAMGNNADSSQIRYHTVAGSKSTSILPRHNVPLNPPQIEEQSTAQITPNRILLRTQSLGSVETWNTAAHSHDFIAGKDKDGEFCDVTNSKGVIKEKGWYETSLDSGPQMTTRESLITTHKKMSRHSIINNNQGNYNGKDIIGASGNEEQQQQQKNRTQQRYQPPKILEIPAESKNIDNNTNERGLESPKNCTVVQAGKYQPYREVTKPFEMSDFYKYSTKYRKRNAEIVGSGNNANTNSSNAVCNFGNIKTAQSPVGGMIGISSSGSLNSVISSQNKLPQDPRVNMMIQMSQELRIENNIDERSSGPSPVQKRIYQPLQRMTCQPYNSLRAGEGGEEEWYQSEKESASSATLV